MRLGKLQSTGEVVEREPTEEPAAPQPERGLDQADTTRPVPVAR